VLAGLFCSAAVVSQAAAQQRTYAFDVPAEPLADALRDYGRSADRQLIFTPGSRPRSPGARREGTPRCASRAGPPAHGNRSWLAIRPVRGIMIVRRADAGPPVTAAAVSAGAEPSRLEGVEVVGSRLVRSTEGPVPVTIFDRQRIESQGAVSVADVLKYLPQQPFAVAGNFQRSRRAIRTVAWLKRRYDAGPDQRTPRRSRRHCSDAQRLRPQHHPPVRCRAGGGPHRLRLRDLWSRRGRRCCQYRAEVSDRASDPRRLLRRPPKAAGRNAAYPSAWAGIPSARVAPSWWTTSIATCCREPSAT